MITDLSKYDLISLVMAESWEEPEQVEFVARFTALMGKYIGEKLAADMPEGADQELQTLLSASDVTPEEVEQFYKLKLPAIQEKIDGYSLEFKKLFLTRFYAKEIEFLKADSSNPKAALLHLWESIMKSVEADDWDTVAATLRQVMDQELDQAASSMTH